LHTTAIPNPSFNTPLSPKPFGLSRIMHRCLPPQRRRQDPNRDAMLSTIQRFNFQDEFQDGSVLPTVTDTLLIEDWHQGQMVFEVRHCAYAQQNFYVRGM
jgi:hypothetical protein